jgi:hypothetical protein
MLANGSPNVVERAISCEYESEIANHSRTELFKASLGVPRVAEIEGFSDHSVLATQHNCVAT